METQDVTATAETNTTMMPHPSFSPPSSSRPTLGFPLGTALLLVVIFSLSGVFSCCYHWDKLQSIRRRLRPRSSPDGEDAESGADNDLHNEHGIPSPPSKTNNSNQLLKQDKGQSLPVIMPGDRIPTFMAWPCPCDPSASLPPPLQSPPLKIVVIDVHIPPLPPPQRLPSPPPITTQPSPPSPPPPPLEHVTI